MFSKLFLSHLILWLLKYLFVFSVETSGSLSSCFVVSKSLLYLSTLSSGSKIFLPQNNSILLPFEQNWVTNEREEMGCGHCHLSVQKRTWQAEVHPIETQYLCIFTALNKCGSASRLEIIFDSQTLNYLFISSVQKSVGQTRCISV